MIGSKKRQVSERLTSRQAKSSSPNQGCARYYPVLALTWLLRFCLGSLNAQKPAYFYYSDPHRKIVMTVLALFERNRDVAFADFRDLVEGEVGVLVESVGFGFGLHEVDEAGWDVARKRQADVVVGF